MWGFLNCLADSVGAKWSRIFWMSGLGRPTCASMASSCILMLWASSVPEAPLSSYKVEEIAT